MLHCERFSVEVSRQQSLRMVRCQQVDRNEVWIRIPVCVEIDGRFDVGPFCLGYRRISMQEIIESQTRPPCDCAPTFDAHEASNLVMDLAVCEKNADVERNGSGQKTAHRESDAILEYRPDLESRRCSCS